MTQNDPDLEAGARLLRAMMYVVPDARAAIDHILLHATAEEREGACREAMQAARVAVEASGQLEDQEGGADQG